MKCMTITNVVSYSLYGSGERYLRGSLMNAHQMPYAYPGWAMVVYHDDTVPAAHLKYLAELGVNLIKMPRSVGRSGSFWRFHAGEDPRFDGKRVVCRDIDSMFTPRELAAVKSWEQSRYLFHVMRNRRPDASRPGGLRPLHAGLFGMIGGSLPGLVNAIAAWPNKQTYFEDEYFQRDWIWPKIQSLATVHSVNDPDANPYPCENPHGWLSQPSVMEFIRCMPKI